MSCISCLLTKAIPICTESLTIGTVEADTDYTIYIVNSNTGYIMQVPATSDVDGLLVADISDIDTSFFSPNNKYKIFACLEGDSIDKAVPITMPDEADTVTNCLLVPFVRVFDGEGNVTGQESAILELDLSCEC